MPTAVAGVVIRSAHDHQSDDFRKLPLSKLRVGQSLKFPIHADDGMLLLANGSQINQRMLDILEQRGHRTVLVHRLESAASVSLEPLGRLLSVPESRPGASIGIHNKLSRRLDQELMGSIEKSQKREESPFIKSLPALGTAPYSETLAREIAQKHESFVGDLRDAVQNVVHSRPEGADQAQQMVDGYLNLMVEDIDLFSSFASSPVAQQYPHRHSLHVAMLSLAMGVRAGLSQESLYHLGLGTLLHDVGMLRIPRKIWSGKQPLTGSQQLEMMAHPIYTLEMIGGIEQIPIEAKYVAYQVHERGGGGGYPRRVPADLIHPLAKIAGVADYYVALLSERPFREGVLPYKAIENIINEARQGKLDANAVRWLLQTVSLYPVGSYVLLSDHRLAKVLRTHPAHYDRPVVRVWPKRTKPTDETGEIINLIECGDLRVIEAIPSPVTG